MAFREDTRVTPAEAASFLIVPETCPAIEAAFDKLARGPGCEQIAAELRSYGIEPTDRLCRAFQDIHAKLSAPARGELRNTVMRQGTFPLRLALVQQIEKTMPPGQPESRYVRWLASC